MTLDLLIVHSKGDEAVAVCGYGGTWFCSEVLRDTRVVLRGAHTDLGPDVLVASP